MSAFFHRPIHPAVASILTKRAGQRPVFFYKRKPLEPILGAASVMKGRTKAASLNTGAWNPRRTK